MFNVNEFNKAILERDFNYSILAEKIGLKERILKDKIKDKGRFTIKEINAIQEALLLNMDELNKIFFAWCWRDRREIAKNEDNNCLK